MVELAKVQTGQLLDLLQAVDQRVAVYEQLARGFGNVQVVLEELLNGKERFLVERVDRTLLEYLAQEHFAERDRQLIDQSADAEVLKADDVLLGIEYRADLDGGRCLLEGLCDVLHLRGNRADADEALDRKLAHEGLLNGGRELDEFLRVAARLDFLDHYDVALRDMQNEILLLVREHTGHNVDRRDIGRLLLTNEEYHARHIVAEVQLAGLDVNIARQDVVQNDILDEGRLVVLLVVKRLDVVDGYSHQRTDAAGQFILALYEYGVFQTRRTVSCNMVGITAETNDLPCETQLSDRLFAHFTDTGQIGARDNRAARIHNTNGAIHRVLHL